ncbi:hypothetical protein BDB00DRAFT_296718 [Zychaea mexicana]|uniref:uncharacterized protein n=1 Tax=Zychaea mexicana TaxID=64656 RepID=UPI0022FF0D34|nr:uncharacterized protein BDB00DRAFT_296718 [Zychaea mexicana]KAI9494614.1 hypothetical protein BDB00DRAFT_296718 [Zychaea mexicana]
MIYSNQKSGFHCRLHQIWLCHACRVGGSSSSADCFSLDTMITMNLLLFRIVKHKTSVISLFISISNFKLFLFLVFLSLFQPAFFLSQQQPQLLFYTLILMDSEEYQPSWIRNCSQNWEPYGCLDDVHLKLIPTLFLILLAPLRLYILLFKRDPLTHDVAQSRLYFVKLASNTHIKSCAYRLSYSSTATEIKSSPAD